MYILLHQRNATWTSWKQIYLRPTEFNCSQRFSSFPGLFCHVPWTQVLKPIRKDGACCKHRFWKVWLLMITCDYSWLDSITFFDGASYCLWTDSSILYLMIVAVFHRKNLCPSILACLHLSAQRFRPLSPWVGPPKRNSQILWFVALNMLLDMFWNQNISSLGIWRPREQIAHSPMLLRA